MLDEADLDRIATPATWRELRLCAEADTRIEFPLHLVEIARASTTVLADPALASTMGGPIAVRPQKTEKQSGNWFRTGPSTGSGSRSTRAMRFP